MSSAEPQKSAAERPVRVGYLLKMYPRFSQTFIVNEILELERQGLDVRIVSLRRPGDGMFHESVSRVKAKADYLPETFAEALKKLWRTRRSGTNGSPGLLGGALGALLRHRDVRSFELIQARLLVRWTRKNRVNHLHVHFGTTEATVAWLGRMLGGPSYSLTLHAFDIFRDNVNKELLAAKINDSRFTVTVCESNREYIVNELPGVNSDRVRVNYNGIDLERFATNGQARDGMVFTVGRLIEKKGFIHLVHAMRRLHDEGLQVECQIAGEGPEEKRLREEIKRMGLEGRVRLVGALHQDQVRERMQHAGCFALPCVKAKDGNVDALPTVLLEAMACGCPTVSTAISGVPEIIEDGASGRLVRPGDDRALADAIRAVLTDGSLAAQLGEGGRRRAEQRFDVRQNVRVMHNWMLGDLAAPAGSQRRAAVPHRGAS